MHGTYEKFTEFSKRNKMFGIFRTLPRNATISKNKTGYFQERPRTLNQL